MRVFDLNSDSNQIALDSISSGMDSIGSSATDTLQYGIPNSDALPYRNAEKTVQEVQEPIIEMTPEDRVTSIQSWQTILLVFTLFLVGFARAFNMNRTVQSIRALFNYVVAQEIVREEKVFFHRGNLILTLVHLLNTSLFIHFVIITIGTPIEIGNLSLFALIVSAVTLTYFIKYLFSKVLFFVLNGGNMVVEYIFNVSLYNNLLGLMLLPILGLAFFSEVNSVNLISYIALPLSVLVIFLRLFRLILIGKANGVSYLYIFLYICTLEILPLVVLYGIFIHE